MSESQVSYKAPSRLVTPEFNYLKRLIQFKLQRYFGIQGAINEQTIPALDQWSLHVPESIIEAGVDNFEKTLLLLALCPHIQSNLIDSIVQSTLESTGDFPQMGGVRGKNFRGFLPTGQTVLFLLAGDDIEKQRQVYNYFDSDHFFSKNRILWLDEAPEGEPRMSGKLVMNPDYVDLFLRGKATKPSFSMKFPAQIITTEKPD